MPLKTFDTKDAVPEAQRASAIETKDGKFVIEEAVDPALGEKGKKALQDERDAKEAAEKDAKEAKKKLAELEKKVKAKESGVTDEELEKLRLKEEAERKPLVDENEKLKAENRQLKLTDQVRALALKHGVMEDRIKDAMAVVSPRSDLTTDGKNLVFKDKDGAVTTNTPEQFFAAIKKESPWFFSGSGGAGGGSTGSDGDSGGGDGAEAARKAGKDAAAVQKRSAADNALALR